jgi:hypothetical protein
VRFEIEEVLYISAGAGSTMGYGLGKYRFRVLALNEIQQRA